MSNGHLAFLALVVVLVAIVYRKDVKAAFNFMGIGSFEIEAKSPRRQLRRRPVKSPPVRGLDPRP